MNYIKEMNAFHDRMMTTDLSVSAKVLWYTFMHVNNKAGWVKEFSIAERLICGLTGLSSSAFKRARIELRDEGFIVYRSRGSKAPMYEIVSLVRKREEVVGEVKTEEVSEVVDEEMDEEADDVVVPLYKQNETKGNGNNTTSISTTTDQTVSHQFYNEHFENPSKYIENEITIWVNRLNDKVVMEAMRRALESAQPVWRYVKGILENWVRANCETVTDVFMYEAEFREARG